MLADLPFPVVITTNYDDFMLQAFKWKLKDARREICRWQDVLDHVDSIFEKDPGYTPTPANPLVFHLHGAMDIPESMVLTEDDYLSFLVRMAAKSELLPDVVQRVFAATTFLFIGYRLGDWNFRVIFQALRARQQFSSVIVLKPLDEKEGNRAAQQAYFEKYFGAIEMKIFWGTAREFGARTRIQSGFRRTSVSGRCAFSGCRTRLASGLIVSRMVTIAVSLPAAHAASSVCT